MGNLSNLYVSRSFQSLIHLATDNTASVNLIGLEDGYGNPIGVSVNTAGDLSISGSFTASLQNGYVWVGNGSGKTTLVATSSFATTGSNQFNGSQSISGSITISGSVSNVDYIDFNTASVVPAWKSGRVFWDNTDGCLGVYNAEADITLQVGQETWVRVRNQTGTTISNGAVVRLVGALGDNPTIVLAQSQQMSGSVPTTNQILGIATHDIETGTNGYVTTLGNVRGLNTSAYNEGDVLFVSSSAGLLTKVVPTAPFERIPVATVVKAGPGGSGIIYVAPIPPIDFATLSTVEISGNYTDSDVWIYEGNVWTHANKGAIGLTTTSSFNVYTSSLNTSASLALTTASVSGTTMTFTKGNGTTFNVTLPTGSGGGGVAFPYTGSAQITGSLGVTGSLSTLPITLSVAATTASIDMRAGNTFVLNIPTGSTTHIVPTNIIAGQTINLLLKQAAGATTGSVAWSPLVLFPSGYDLVATSTGSAIDLVSMISFDTTNLMAANVKNLK